MTRQLVREGNVLRFVDDLPSAKPSTRYAVPNVMRQTIARRAFVRRVGPNGERVPGGIVESVMGDGALSCKEAEAALVDAAEKEGITRNDNAPFRIVEESEPGMREGILRERENRGLVSYPGRTVRRKRLTPGKYGNRAP
jgi:hypothetical protein